MIKSTLSLTLMTVTLATLGSIAPLSIATAQITPDNSLGSENSVVSPDVIDGIPSDRLDGGAIRGSNLFHSFQEFNVDEGRGAFFSNPNGIANILTRVTGGNPSNILGTLGVLGNANLYLINPKGIFFGPNARLNLGGSFFATTADSLVFDNNFEFSATNPETPPLLTVNIPIGLRFRDNPGNIATNRSVASDGTVVRSILQTQPGKTLALVGGNVNLDGGVLLAPGGRVELGGLAVAGTVGINADGSLSFPDGVTRADVTLSNNALVGVSGQGGGSIGVNARNFEIFAGTDTTGFGAGILSPGAPEAQAGDIVINATDKVRIEGNANSSAGIFNGVDSSSSGNAGDVIINTSTLEGIDRFAIISSNLGQGNAGKISITAKDQVSFQGLEGTGSGVGILLGESTIGKADDITINTRSLSLSNFAQLTTSSTGQAKAANIRINASESISVSGNSVLQAANYGSGNAGNIIIDAENATVSFDGPFTSINTGLSSRRANTSGVDLAQTRQGGDIIIKAREFSVTNGAQLFTTTFANGNAGNVKLNISDKIQIAGESDQPDSNGNFSRSSISSVVGIGATGNAGNIEMTTRSLLIADGGLLNSSTFGKGNAGNITINASDTVSFNGTSKTGASSAVYSTVATGGEGNGGDIKIIASSVSLTNEAQLSGDVSSGATGNAGNIEIFTGSLFVNGASQINSGTSGKGNAGNITINASDTVSFDGAKNGDFPSGVFSIVDAGGEGKGGDINITARSFLLTNGGSLNTFVREASDTEAGGIGDAGNVKLNISDTIQITGKSEPNSNGDFTKSGIFSSVESGTTGNAGNIEIVTGSLLMSDGLLSSRTFGQGNAGNINITTGSLFVTDGGQLSSSTFGQGDAGNVIINATDTVSFNGTDNQGAASAVFSTVEAGGEGKGGDISITARSLSLTNGGRLNTFVRETSDTDPGGIGDAGNVKLNISDAINIAGESDKVDTTGNFVRSGIFSEVRNGARGNAGSIDISTGSLFVTDGGQLLSNTSGQGDAGSIKINANSLSLKNGAQLNTNSDVENRQAGNIEVTTAKDIQLDNQALITANTQGGEGNIILDSRDLILRRNSNITTNATGTATGGNININTGNLVAFENSDISANAQESFGGRVSITAQSIFGTEFRERLTPQSDITATSELGPQFSGTVQINTPDVDPSQGLTELPENVTDPSDKIASNPCQKGSDSAFIITGRGGIPSSPNQSFKSDNVRVDLVEPVTRTSNSQTATITQPETSATSKRIVPAQGWVLNNKGEVVLVAYDPTASNPQRTSQKTAACLAPF
jgi:filamentous hemagglutinin family protein